jgi:hypothetical protein
MFICLLGNCKASFLKIVLKHVRQSMVCWTYWKYVPDVHVCTYNPLAILNINLESRRPVPCITWALSSFSEDLKMHKANSIWKIEMPSIVGVLCAISTCHSQTGTAVAVQALCDATFCRSTVQECPPPPLFKAVELKKSKRRLGILKNPRISNTPLYGVCDSWWKLEGVINWDGSVTVKWEREYFSHAA